MSAAKYLLRQESKLSIDTALVDVDEESIFKVILINY